MTVNRGLAVRQNGAIGVTPLEHRLSMAGLFAQNSPGVPRQGLLEAPSATIVSGASGWTYNVAANHPVIVRATSDGVYLPTFTGSTSIACSVAPGTGFRYDLVWVKQNDIDKGDPDNLATLGVTEGAASASPAKPYASVPAGAYVLAESLVGAGATGTNHASVTITQVWRHTVARGAPIPVRDATELAEITGFNGAQVVRLDKGNRVDTFNNGAWGNREYLVPRNTGWVDVAGTIPLRVDVREGLGVLNGYVIRSSGSDTTIGYVPLGARPVKDVTWVTQAENTGSSPSGGSTFRIYVSASDGRITINQLGGGGSWLTTSRIPLNAFWAVA